MHHPPFPRQIQFHGKKRTLASNYPLLKVLYYRLMFLMFMVNGYGDANGCSVKIIIKRYIFSYYFTDRGLILLLHNVCFSSSFTCVICLFCLLKEMIKFSSQHRFLKAYVDFCYLRVHKLSVVQQCL